VSFDPAPGDLRLRSPAGPAALIDLAMSRPIVVIICMGRSSESWVLTAPAFMDSRAGGGAVHSITNGLMHRSKKALFDHLIGADE
jgi:hypothetical protein